MWEIGFWNSGFWSDNFWPGDVQLVEFRFVLDSIQPQRKIASFKVQSVFLNPDDARILESMAYLRDLVPEPIPKIATPSSAARSILEKSPARSFLS